MHRPVFKHGHPSSGYPPGTRLRVRGCALPHSGVLEVGLRSSRLERPGHPAEGWVVFLNASWY